ncbi:MAG: DUF2604 domain-containing protein [Gaiellaceae bacterium]
MPNKIDVTVVVNGSPVVVEANQNAPLHTVISKALQQTGNSGQPPENWELRDAAGTLLDGSKKIEDFGFPADVRVFLSLKAGVGGHA